jgi:hypothetical protein
MLPLALLYCVHVVFMFYSLKNNRPGTVQILKHMCAPFIMLITALDRVKYSIYAKLALVCNQNSLYAVKKIQTQPDFGLIFFFKVTLFGGCGVGFYD